MIRQVVMRVPLWMSAAVAVLFVTIPCLSGCAEVLLISSTAVLVGKALPSGEPQWVGIGRRTFAYPVADVYEAVVREVQTSGKEIVERDPEAHSLLISYPFSLLKNNWGGSLRITCTANEFGTAVTIVGNQRDAVTRVRAIGDEVLGDVEKALRRQPRTL